MKEKDSVKTTKLFLKLLSSFVRMCYSLAVAVLNLVRADFLSG